MKSKKMVRREVKVLGVGIQHRTLHFGESSLIADSFRQLIRGQWGISDSIENRGKP